MAEVKFKFVGDDSELRKKLANLAKIQSEMTEKFSADLNKTVSNGTSQVFKDLAKDAVNAAREADILNKTASNKAITNAKLEQIEAIKQLREQRSKEISDLNVLKQIEQEYKALLAEKKKDTEALSQQEKQLNIEYKKGQIELQEYNKILKEQTEARRAAMEDERKAEKAVRDSERARKDAEREAAKQTKEVEKRKKQLEQESSEYYKLNKALGAVRKETKDVLAEMFRMERQGHANTLGYEALRQKADALTKQTQYLDQGIKKIDATLGLHQRNVGNYGEALELISPQFANINQKLQLFGTSIEDLAKKPGAIKELGNAFISVGKGILAFVLSPVGLLVTAVTGLFMLFQRNKQTVIDFNNGLLNVSKTTGLAGGELQGLSDDIIKLSRALKTVSTNKLLEYATVAGQLGVKGRANILAFTEALAMLETASDISGEEGGAKIARMLTLVDGGVQNVKAFGDEIVNLGNNFAATESEILSNAESIAQNTGIYKIGRQEVLAYATATKAVGLEAELVGSTFSRTLGEMEKTLRTGKGVDNLLKVIGGSQDELKKKFKQDAAGVFTDYISGLNRISKAGGSVNEALERTGIIAVRDQRVIASLATAGFDTLSRSLDTVKSASGAMQEEFETASSKIVNQSKRIGIAWDNLVLSIENGSGVIGKAAVVVVDSLASILEGITNIVTSQSFKEFFVRFGELSGDKFSRNISKTLGDTERFDSNGRVRNDLVPYKDMQDFYKASADEQERLLKAQEETYQLRLKEYQLSKTKKSLDELNYQAEVRAKMIAKVVKPVAAAADASKESEFGETDAQKRAREAAEKKEAHAVEQRRQAGERQRALQLEIDKVNEQVARNNLSRDQLEIASVKDKYNKLREEARKFYANPKNAGLKVDLSGLTKSERFETNEATTRIETTKLIESLSKQKGIYNEYFSYLESTSKEEADKRYKNELELVKGFKTNLQKEYMDIISLGTIAENGVFEGIGGKLTQAQEERAKALKEMIDALDKEERDRDHKRYLEMFSRYATYEEKRQRIIQDSEAKIAFFTSQGEIKNADIVRKERDQLLNDLAASEVESLKGIDSFLNNLNELSYSVRKEGLKVAKYTFEEWIKKAKLSGKEVDALRRTFDKFFKNAERGTSELLVTGLVNISGELKNITNSTSDVDSGFGKVLNTVGDLVGGVGEVTAALKRMKEAQSSRDFMSGLSGFLAIYGAMYKTFSGIADAINQTNELQWNHKLELRTKEIEAQNRQFEYQIQLIDTLNGTDKLDKIKQNVVDLQDIINKTREGLSGKVEFSGDKRMDDLIKDLNAGKKSVSDFEKQLKQLQYQYNTMPINSGSDAAKKAGILGNINLLQKTLDHVRSSLKLTGSESLEDLIKLSAQFDDETRKQIENLIDYEKKLADLKNSLSENILGFSSKSMIDELVSLFSQGKISAKDFSDTFEGYMKKAIINSLSQRFLQEQLTGLYSTFEKMVEKNEDKNNTDKAPITDADIAELRKKYDEIIANAGKNFEAWQKITGIDFDSTSSLQSESIARQLSESTGSEIVGTFRAGLDVWNRSLKVAEANGLVLRQQLDAANNNLVVLNSINVNTANTVTRLDAVVGELVKVNKNLGGAYVG